MSDRVRAVYRIRCEADAIEARAQAIAVEQSVEMPPAAIDDARVRRDIVGRVEAIAPVGPGEFEATIGLAPETIGEDAGQLLNMLFGNTSLHEEVVLVDVEVPTALAGIFGGPRHGIAGLRRRIAAPARALTMTALKPQGLPPERLADLAVRFAQGGIDYIKDDHGLADQSCAPFAARLAAVTAALRASKSEARYVPSLSGDLDAMRRQLAAAAATGVDTVMVAPMIMGLSNFQRLVREHPDAAFIAHPAMAGAARVAPPLLVGKLFRLLGADAVIFPNHGGRFGYSVETCRALADAARKDWHGLLPSTPVPAGGMTTARVREMLDFYGTEVMLLIGGALLEAGDGLPAATAAFVAEVGDDDGESTRAMTERIIHRRAKDYRWEGVEELPYKEDDRALFKSVTRQVLFSDPDMRGELRYFEVAPGGYSTLERHQHMHAVMVLRGRGLCLVGGEVRPVETRDLVTVPPMTWHQFRASRGEPLGFLCMVDATRDKPQLPTRQDIEMLEQDRAVAAFLRNES